MEAKETDSVLYVRDCGIGVFYRVRGYSRPMLFVGEGQSGTSTFVTLSGDFEDLDEFTFVEVEDLFERVWELEDQRWPKSPRMSHRAFKDGEEFREKVSPGTYFKYKDSEHVFPLQWFMSEVISLPDLNGEGCLNPHRSVVFTWDEFFWHCETADGEPCGVSIGDGDAS